MALTPTASALTTPAPAPAATAGTSGATTAQPAAPAQPAPAQAAPVRPASLPPIDISHVQTVPEALIVLGQRGADPSLSPEQARLFFQIQEQMLAFHRRAVEVWLR